MRNLSQQLKNLSPEQRALLEAKLKEQGIQWSEADTIAPRKSNELIPLSFAQQRLWFVQQLEPENSSYNVPCALRLDGELDHGALEKALNEIVRRHEILRTIFVTNADKQPVQKVREFQEFVLDVIPEKESTEKLINETVKQPFNLGESLLRIKLLRLAEDSHILVIATHHIVSDRWSIGVFLREIAVLYRAYLQQQSSPLGKLPIQYGDWAIWQRDRLKEAELERQVSYWKKKLNNISVLELPCDRTRLPVPSYQGAKLP
ncbi:MAG: condensation domain-containing protein, partial [Cyanobacteria bacterium J06558_2]